MTSQINRIANLSPEKQALFAKRLLSERSKQQATARIPALPRRAAFSPCPLSFAQERLWFLAQMDPDSPFYHIAGVVRMEGRLHEALLEQALNESIRRHEALRTTFINVNDKVMQRIEQHCAIRLMLTDLSALPAHSQTGEMKKIELAEAARPFDLEQGPLLRARLVKLAEQRHLLLMTMHHIISDGWSLGLLIEEVSGFYETFSQGQPSAKPELSLQYADFACWQRERMRDGLYAEQLSYWTQRLASAPTLLELPTDRPRPSELSYRGAGHSFTLNAELTGALRQLSRATDTTLFMVLIAAFNVMLQRCSGQDDLCVGYPVAGRNRKDIENLIGFFVNTQVLRSDLSANPSFTGLLSQIKTNILAAQNHQDLPFEHVVEALRPERTLSHAPLFQVMFAFQNAPMAGLQLPGVRFTIKEAEINAAKFDLLLTVTNGLENLQCRFDYSSDLFDEASVIRMSGYLQRLLAGIVRQPEARISELPLLGEAEWRLIMTEWNDSKAGYPHYPYLHGIIERQVLQTPEAIAVVFENERLSYAELNTRANQLAHYLLAQGIGPDRLVGVCLERSERMVIALLGILKAGGAYLPLDPDYPRERLAFMVNDAAPSVVLTEKHWLDHHEFGASRVLCLDTEWAKRADADVGNPAITIMPEHLAYCIYTSGSTGQPKGVGVPHQGILNRLQWMQDEYRLDDGDRVLQKTPYSFDVSVWEFFWPLMTGARLIVARPGDHKDSFALIDTIIREQVTTVHFVPSMLHAFIDTPGVEKCTSLKRVICSGEALPADCVARFRQKCRAGLHNLYGPTEASVDVSFWACLPGRAETAIPIGRPIANTALHILDRHLNPVPPGTPGELHIAGIGLGRGYLNRPGLTAEKFIANPYDQAADGQQGGRLYKTGDLARYRADGAIEYLGRIDHQVKIRGFRIELGEIEARLLSHAEVREAVVIACEDRQHDKRLVAYVVGTVKSDVLKAYLADVLPDYMIPAAFVTLDAMPLSANGKLDRKRLPQPGMEQPANNHYEEAQTPVEKILADIWREVLAVSRVGRHDNFFELGGDSILSIQVVSRARRAGIVISPKQLFQYQTPAGLAAVAGKAGEIAAEQGAVSGHVALTPIQQWFFEQALDNPHHWNQALFLETSPELRPDILEAAFNHLAAHHDMLRVRFNRQDGEWRQYLPADQTRAVFERVDLSGVSEQDQAARLESAASVQQARINLSEGPLLRAVWFDLGQEQAGRVLIVIHHLLVDGVSWRILLDDLATLCRQLMGRQLMAGQTPALAAKTSSFKYWAEQTIDRVRSGDLALDARYWLNQDYDGVADLPVDQAGGGNRLAMEEELTVMLTEAETAALLQDAPGAYGMKTDELLLTALALTLRAWTASEAVLIDLEGHGREDISSDLDVSRTVGWFTTLYPLVLNVSGHAGLDEALKSVKEQLRAIPMKGMSYGLLRYASPDRQLRAQLASRSKAQVIFNYLGQFDTAMASDAPFGLSSESTGLSCAPDGLRGHEWVIVGSVSDGRMRLGWRYSRERYRRDTIAGLTEQYARRLRAIIAHCTEPGAGAYTPSDFPLAALTQADLDGMALPPRRIENIYPLAPLQHGLMFHSLYAPESGLYCIQFSCRLTGELNVPEFKQAWRQLVGRHPVLRSRFHLQNQGQPLQIVCKQAEAPITYHDWRPLAPAEQALRWRQVLADDQSAGFDFTEAPLMRLVLARCSGHEHLLLWSYHHILLDGWSCPLLLKELFSLYRALCAKETVVLPPVRPYSDYIGWLRSQDRVLAEAYWRSALAGFIAPAPLIADGAKADGGPAYARQRLDLAVEDGQTLRRFVKQRQLTLNTLVQGAWGLLLSRYGGGNDVVFGVTVSGRPADLVGVESMVGLFINTLPMRIHVRSEAEPTAWLQELFAQNQEMRRYEYTPLTQIQGWSQVPRGLQLFESLLVFENYPIDQALAENFAGLKVDAVNVADQSNYPLTLSVIPGAELRLEISYATDRFEEATITRMLAHLQHLLMAFAGQAHSRLSELPLLDAAEQRRILCDWTLPAVEYPADQCIHQRFEAQAKKTPDACALVFEEQALSYAELNSKADRLAHYLCAQGVGPDVPVGLCLERSLEMVIGLLAVLKAGGAYVPLDPAYPRQRIAYMLEDSAAVLVITRQDVLPILAGVTTPCFCIDSDWPKTANVGYSSETPASAPVRTFNLVRPLNLAYVIYTSGSTGKPKGVMVPHHQVLRLFDATQEQFHFSERDVWTLFHSYAFDFSVWEIWGALLYGGRLVIVPYWLSRSPDEFYRLLHREQVTVLNQTPSAFLQLMQAEEQQEPPADSSLRLVIFGGEALEPLRLKPWFERHGDHSPQLINMYGITETTVHVTYRRLTRQDLESAAPSPIGRPLADLQTYLLDADANLCPVHVRGELHVGGAGLARGYLNRPELTAERFIPNPFGKPGSRLYKSGDMACYRLDGDLGYSGRIDHQVKIRGFRIELGEIENRLLRHPGVDQAVVLVREDSPGDKRLTAYIVNPPDQPPAIDDLNVFLKSRLPDYMLPNAYVFLSTLPLTANGKLDRKALPAPDVGERLKQRYLAPRSATETVLADMWAELLGLERVGIEDHFFDLGGHSLIATQLVSRLNRAFAIEIPLKMLFEAGTVEKLAEQIDLAMWTRNRVNEASRHDEIDYEEIEL